MADAQQPSPPLPAGRVTFLLTDIEGSTRLFQELGDEYVALLGRHNALLRDAFGRHGGAELDTEGDAFVVAFADATAAVRACVEGQLALRSHEWPPGAALRVRMGLHTEDATPTDGQYVSLGLHRAARICAGGHGGQILLSDATASAVRGTLPADVGLTPLGSFQLRGFAEPTRLLQVTHPLLPVDFPPLRAQGVVHHNLPFHRAGLVGRSRERAALAQAIRQTGVVTVVGTGGVGKTRLAVQVAFDVMDDFDDGAWLVELASATGRSDVAGAVASALHVAERPGRSLEEAVLDHLAAASALVVLDNCEQVVQAAADFAEQLTRRAPNVVVVATSREPLGIEGEVVWQLGPLPVPDPDDVRDAGGLAGQDSVRLFAERAALVRPGFAVTDANATALAGIVARLDGIPLAIELAAAAVADRSVDEVLEGLADRFSLLVHGRRTAPERHQTLRSALAWSLDLLTPDERLLFGRLAAFARGGAFPDTRAVCGTAPLSEAVVPSLVRRLVRASLVSLTEEGRWTMLESVHELAELESARRGEADEFAERHRGWFAQRVEALGPEVGLRGRREVLASLLADLPNLRRALATGVAAGDSDRCLRIATALARFWMARGDWTAGVAHLQDALALPGGDELLRGRALEALGSLMILRGQLAPAESVLREATAIAGAEGVGVTLARSLSGLGYVAFRRSELDEAEARWREARQHAEHAGDDRVVAGILRSLAIAVASRGDQDAAGRLLDQGIRAAERAGDDQQLRLLLGSKAEIEIWLGHYDVARDIYSQALDLATTIGDVSARPLLLSELGWVAFLTGDVVTALRLSTQAAGVAEELGNHRILTSALRLRAEAQSRRGRFEDAAADLDRALALAEEQGALADVAGVRCTQACAALEQLRLDEAATHARGAVAVSKLGHALRSVLPQWVLGVVALADGDLEEAGHQFRIGVAEGGASGALRHQASSRWGLAGVSCAAGAVGEAARLHRDALDLRHRIGDRLGVVESLLASARLVAPGDPASASALTAAAERRLTELGAALTPRLAADVSVVRAQLRGHPAPGEGGPIDDDEAVARAEAALRAVEGADTTQAH